MICAFYITSILTESLLMASIFTFLRPELASSVRLHKFALQFELMVVILTEEKNTISETP